MEQQTFVSKLNNTTTPDVNEDVCDGIFKQYEDVVIQSLITSFGLDMFINDKHGGDVDTVHNVREIGRDPKMGYKNSDNAKNYANRGEYNFGEYHGDSRFTQVKHEARSQWQENYKDIDDQYTNGKIGFYGHTKSISPERKAELDHIVETKSIHEERGRVLAGLNGTDLANSRDNLAWTNKSLNASMGAWAKGVNERYKKEHCCDVPMDMVDIKAYVEAHPNLDAKTKENLLNYHKKAMKAYNDKINRAYYTSKSFFKDTAKATAKLSVKMGLRQALGLVFSEIWFAVRGEIVSSKTSFRNIFSKIADGIKKGLVNAKAHYSEIWNKFVEGAIAGAISSLVTTLCNIFFTTAKNLVRIIRQTWASLVEATKILLWNPDDLLFGERFRAATKILATGASVVAGYMVSELVHETPVGTFPLGIGDIVMTFCGTLVTGIMSCSLLYLLDHNPIINRIVDVLNKIPTIEKVIDYYKQQAALLEEYSAKLMEIDLGQFKEETKAYSNALETLESATSEEDMNARLPLIYDKLNIELPWKGFSSFDSFMNDKSSVLRFE